LSALDNAVINAINNNWSVSATYQVALANGAFTGNAFVNSTAASTSTGNVTLAQAYGSASQAFSDAATAYLNSQTISTPGGATPASVAAQINTATADINTANAQASLFDTNSFPPNGSALMRAASVNLGGAPGGSPGGTTQGAATPQLQSMQPMDTVPGGYVPSSQPLSPGVPYHTTIPIAFDPALNATQINQASVQIYNGAVNPVNPAYSQLVPSEVGLNPTQIVNGLVPTFVPDGTLVNAIFAPFSVTPSGLVWSDGVPCSGTCSSSVASFGEVNGLEGFTRVSDRKFFPCMQEMNYTYGNVFVSSANSNTFTYSAEGDIAPSVGTGGASTKQNDSANDNSCSNAASCNNGAGATGGTVPAPTSGTNTGRNISGLF
jgi:hypothetical protein